MEQGKPETRWGVVKNKGKVQHDSKIKDEPITKFSVWEDERRKTQVTEENKLYVKVYGVSVLLVIIDWKAPRVFLHAGGK